MKKGEQDNTIQRKNYTSNGDFFKKKKKKQTRLFGKNINVQNEIILS